MKKEKIKNQEVEEKVEEQVEQTQESTESTPEKTIEELEARIADLEDKNLRMMAEFDNYRRRTNKEKLELMATAGERIFKEMLPLPFFIEPFSGIGCLQDFAFSAESFHLEMAFHATIAL